MFTKIKRLPKIELHRHWEASIRLETIIDIAKEHGIEMPEYDVETVRPFVQVMPDEPHSMEHFLNKFATLRQFYRSIPIIERITREIVEDAAQDNVKYMELRFTPKALVNISGCSVDDVVRAVCDTSMKAAIDNDITVRLIASMNRHEEVKFGEKVLRAAVENKTKGIVGIDLAGNEELSAVPFRSIFREAKEEGLGITIHAGEWNGANSVWDALGNLNADRIGHGVRALEDPLVTAILIERKMVLECCPSSNVLSGIFPSLDEHPIKRMIQMNLQVTINTDDPIICNIDLSDEIYYTMKYMDLSLDDVKQCIICSARSAFLPSDEREKLVTQFQTWLADF